MDIQPQETQLTDEETEDRDVLEEMMPDLYTETATKLLYEVKFFQSFVLVRPATPLFYLAIKKISPLEFSRDFLPFEGDHEAARDAIRGAEPEMIIT